MSDDVSISSVLTRVSKMELHCSAELFYGRGNLNQTLFPGMSRTRRVGDRGYVESFQSPILVSSKNDPKAAAYQSKYHRAKNSPQTPVPDQTHHHDRVRKEDVCLGARTIPVC